MLRISSMSASLFQSPLLSAAFLLRPCSRAIILRSLCSIRLTAFSSSRKFGADFRGRTFKFADRVCLLFTFLAGRFQVPAFSLCNSRRTEVFNSCFAGFDLLGSQRELHGFG